MKIILLGMLIIFLLGMTAQLVVYTIIAYIKEDCSRKMMRTVFVKNTILRYEECTKLGIPVDNVKRFVENTFDSCIYGGYSPDLIADVSKKSGNIIIVMGILSVIFHINNLQECFVYISMTLLEVIALRVSEKMTDYNENKKNHIKHCSEFVVAFNSCSCKNIRIQITTVFSTGYYGRHNRRCINRHKFKKC